MRVALGLPLIVTTAAILSGCRHPQEVAKRQDPVAEFKAMAPRFVPELNELYKRKISGPAPQISTFAHDQRNSTSRAHSTPPYSHHRVLVRSHGPRRPLRFHLQLRVSGRKMGPDWRDPCEANHRCGSQMRWINSRHPI